MNDSEVPPQRTGLVVVSSKNLFRGEATFASAFACPRGVQRAGQASPSQKVSGVPSCRGYPQPCGILKSKIGTSESPRLDFCLACSLAASLAYFTTFKCAVRPCRPSKCACALLSCLGSRLNCFRWLFQSKLTSKSGLGRSPRWKCLEDQRQSVCGSTSLSR